jgi:hypothetical protein
MYSPQNGGLYWVYGDSASIWTVDTGGSHVDRTNAGGWSVDASWYSGGNLNGVAVVNAKGGVPQYWVEANPTFQDLPGLRANTLYDVVRPFKYHLVGLGYTDGAAYYSDGLHWSDAADPGNIPSTWVPAEDNEAGDNIIADELGAIVDGHALRDSFYIYKQDTVYRMDYIGGNEVFRFTKVFGTQGVLARDCVARVRGHHVVLGNGDIYRHDGQNVETLATGRIRREFFQKIDKENYAKSFVVYQESTDLVFFVVPRAGSQRPDFALVWNTVTDDWSYQDWAQGVNYGASGIVSNTSSTDDTWETGPDVTWDGNGAVWAATVGSLDTTEDSVLLLNAGFGVGARFDLLGGATDFNGEPFEASVRLDGLDFGDPMRVKMVRRVWPRVDMADEFSWTLKAYCQDRVGDAPQLAQTITSDDANLDDGIPLNVNTRYLGLELSSDQQADWAISGLDIEYEYRGHF